MKDRNKEKAKRRGSLAKRSYVTPHQHTNRVWGVRDRITRPGHSWLPVASCMCPEQRSRNPDCRCETAQRPPCLSARGTVKPCCFCTHSWRSARGQMEEGSICYFINRDSYCKLRDQTWTYSNEISLFSLLKWVEILVRSLLQCSQSEFSDN